MGGVPVDFERLFAAVPSALLVLDLDLAVVDVNTAYCALLGRRRADLLEAVLPVGSTLRLYTDGLFERRGSDLDQDLERLRATAETLADRDLETLRDELIDCMGYDGEDDVAVLAVRAHDESRSRPPEAGPKRLC